MRRRTEETNTAFNGALSQLMLEAPEQPKVETSPIGQIANLYDIVDGTLQLRKKLRMGIIQVNTPQGVISVNITYDTPTEEEQKAIISGVEKLSAEQSVDTDEAISSKQEIKTQEPEVEIDYKTGISDVGLRMFVAKGDNIDEKVARLNELGIPTEAISQDKKGEVILNRDLIPEEVKSQYNIEGTGLGSIEESDKFTKADFAEFLVENVDLW